MGCQRGRLCLKDPPQKACCSAGEGKWGQVRSFRSSFPRPDRYPSSIVPHCLDPAGPLIPPPQSRYPVFEAASRQAEIGKLDCTDLRPITPNIQEMLAMVNERRELRLDFYFPILKYHFFRNLFCLQCHFS